MPRGSRPGECSQREAEIAAAPNLSEFLLRVCHDLRSGVRAIRSHAELLSKDTAVASAADAQERLQFIVEGAGKIDRLVDGLAGYSLAVATDPSSFVPISASVLLRTVLAKLEPEAREHVSYEELPRVTGDPDRLVQLFENLIRNALLYRADSPPRIHIAANSVESDWVFSVQDNGRGVAAADLERIFKPFTRLDSHPRTGPGLGLASCRAIAEKHGGRIWAESDGRSGCMFLFTLPKV